MTAMNYVKQAAKESGLKGSVFDRKQESETYQSSGKGKSSSIKTYLKVPYSQKGDAKCLGAKWDAGRKQWYCEGSAKKFRQWMK